MYYHYYQLQECRVYCYICWRLGLCKYILNNYIYVYKLMQKRHKHTNVWKQNVSNPPKRNINMSICMDTLQLVTCFQKQTRKCSACHKRKLYHFTYYEYHSFLHTILFTFKIFQEALLSKF